MNFLSQMEVLNPTIYCVWLPGLFHHTLQLLFLIAVLWIRGIFFVRIGIVIGILTFRAVCSTGLLLARRIFGFMAVTGADAVAGQLEDLHRGEGIDGAGNTLAHRNGLEVIYLTAKQNENMAFSNL